ncbi:MAG: helix-turn-helix transcriptional regulator [Cyclobacteriaceae bacterium]
MNLSNQEELVLLSIGMLHPEGYAYGVKQQIKEESGSGISLGTIHTILYRLENERLVKSRMGGSSNKRGGRSKRLYTLTAKGYSLVKEISKVRQSMWEKMSLDKMMLDAI